METQDTEKSVLMSILAGIGVGVLVGAIAGLLLAPKAGPETRDEIGTSLTDLGHKIGDLSQQVATKVKAVVETARTAETAPAEDTAAA